MVISPRVLLFVVCACSQCSENDKLFPCHIGFNTTYSGSGDCSEWKELPDWLPYKEDDSKGISFPYTRHQCNVCLVVKFDVEVLKREGNITCRFDQRKGICDWGLREQHCPKIRPEEHEKLVVSLTKLEVDDDWKQHGPGMTTCSECRGYLCNNPDDPNILFSTSVKSAHLLLSQLLANMIFISLAWRV